jgi:hypothetical protein
LKFALIIIGNDENPKSKNIDIEAESFEELGRKIDSLGDVFRSGSIIMYLSE